jgi:hypothetical protein
MVRRLPKDQIRQTHCFGVLKDQTLLKVPRLPIHLKVQIHQTDQTRLRDQFDQLVLEQNLYLRVPMDPTDQTLPKDHPGFRKDPTDQTLPILLKDRRHLIRCLFVLEVLKDPIHQTDQKILDLQRLDQPNN